MLVLDVSAFKAAMRSLSTVTKFVVDTETTGLQMFAAKDPARLTGIAIGDAEAPGNDWYFSFRHGEGENLPLECLEPLRQLLAGKPWLGHNLGFDVKILAADGFQWTDALHDSQVAAQLANENEESLALKPLSVKYIGVAADDEDKVLKAELRARKLSKGKGEMWRLPATIVGPYAVQDIALTRQLFNDRMKEVTRWRLDTLYTEVMQYQAALLRMEFRGIQLDVDEVHRQMARIAPRLAACEAEIRELSGGINPNSPTQLIKWLQVKTTKKQHLLDLLTSEHRQDIRALLDYREVKKATSTYFQPFLALRDTTDRLHTSYRVTGTVTGRLSSSDPNLQNTSREAVQRNYSVRSCLVAAPGHFLLEADYSAVEPRIAAHYSRDKVMQDNFIQKKDFHTTVARAMFRKADITKEERTDAKSLGLGVLYGMGAYKASVKLALRHNRRPDGSFEPCYHSVWARNPITDDFDQYPCSSVDREYCTHAGREYIGKFYAGLPNLKPCIDRVTYLAKNHGYVRNPVTGRVRRFEGPRAHPHKAFNSLIQQTAAEILRRALVRLDARFRLPNEPQMVLTVHDSIVFEISFSEQAQQWVKEIKEIMETTTTLDVPLVVDLKVGPSLGNMGEIEV